MIYTEPVFNGLALTEIERTLSVIMEEISDIAACGAGTISKRIFDNNRIERCDNVKDVGLYISQIDEMIERKRKLFCC